MGASQDLFGKSDKILGYKLAGEDLHRIQGGGGVEYSERSTENVVQHF